MNIFDALYDIALEADDITGEVKNDTAKAVGSSGEGNAEDPGEISTNTDDVLGLDNKDNGVPEEEDSDSNGEDQDQQDDSEGTEDGEENGDSSDNDFGGDNQDDMGDSNAENKDDPFIKNRKEKLRKQMIHLFDVLVDNIELVTSYVPTANDVTTIKTMTGIKDNLMQCKSIIFKTITEDYNDLEYHELLKRYVGVNRVYEVSTKIMENYFHLKREGMDKKKSRV